MFGHAMMMKSAGGFFIPTGLVVPYNGSSAPSGWSAFTGADGKFLLGAGSTYTQGNSGGGAVSNSASSASAGGHNSGINRSFTGTNGSYCADSANSNPYTHQHTYSCDTLPAYQDLLLIKANGDLTVLPQNAVPFTTSTSTLSGLSQLYDSTYRYLRGNTAPGNAAVAESNKSVGNDAGHNHGGNEGLPNSTFSLRALWNGNVHSHTMTISALTHQLKRIMVAAWTNASADFSWDKDNFIGMWDSGTIPTGWALCDGTGGTPDLRDYFINFDSLANAGTTNATNQVTFNYSLASRGHTSFVGTASTNTAQNGSHNNTQSHSHSGSFSDSSPSLPSWFAMSFIKYTG
jgi:hypothetical protein